MKEQMDDSFPPEVIEKLKYYVYRLMDPRNGETFYVGKGYGNRVFSHSLAAQNLEGDVGENKIDRIMQIRNNGFEVAHIIHRHGMDEETAYEVEAALMDAYPGLTNHVRGFRSNALGVMHAKEIINKYAAEEVVFRHKVLLININQTFSKKSTYEATRSSWVLDVSRAREVDYILAVRNGIIVGVYEAENWSEVLAETIPGYKKSPKRYEFNGKEAPTDIWNHYKDKRVPERKKGAANPNWYADPEQ
jgi:hypothetical protein